MNYENRNHVERFYKQNFEDYLIGIHGEEYLEYRKQWKEAESGRYIPDHPLHIEIGLTSYCNLHCKMCFRSVQNHSVQKHNMSLELVQQIADQCKNMGIAAVALGEGAEGLLHPQIKEIIKIFSNVGLLDYFVMTNGILLNEDISKALIESKVDRLNISIDAATSDTYKRIRGADLKKLEENIDTFLKCRGSRTLPLLRVSFVKQPGNYQEVQMFLEKWRNKADLVDFQDMVDYGNVDTLLEIEKKIDYICPFPFTKMCIRWNGDIYPCTNPYQKYFKIGNLNEMTIEEAWNYPVWAELRNRMLKKDMPLACKNCRGTRFFSDMFTKDNLGEKNKNHAQ